jgi:hypothetical protein
VAGREPAARGTARRARSGALERIAKKTNGAPFGRAEDLVRELPENIALILPEGQKSPDSLLRVTSQTGEVVWWLGDLFSNTTPADQIWPLRLVSRLAGSGPGFRRNARPELVYVQNRGTWLSSIRRAITANPPTIVVPAHGDPVLADAAARTAAVVGDQGGFPHHYSTRGTVNSPLDT